VALLNPGDVFEVESLCLSRLAAMAGSTVHQTAGAGAFSAGIRFLGQQLFNRGATFEKSSEIGSVERAQPSNYAVLKFVRTGVLKNDKFNKSITLSDPLHSFSKTPTLSLF
jgi:hypothetical protein